MIDQYNFPIMLPKNARLNLTKDFRRVASGKRTETRHLVIFYKLEEHSHPLVGIALSKKVSSLSTKRNQIKRKISLSVQSLYPLLMSKLSLIIMPKPGSSEARVEILKQELQTVKGIWGGH